MPHLTIDAVVERIVEDKLRERSPIRPSQTEPGTVEKNWLTNSEAMEFLGLSKPTLQRFRATGRIPFSKLGRSVYYKRRDIEALLEGGVVEVSA